MAVNKLICPECKTVLRPAKPLPPGKPVKCPECGNRFTASEEAPEAPARKPKKAAGGDGAAVARKPAKPAGKAAPKKAPAAGPPPAAAKHDDDDEGGGTYRFAEAGGAAEEEDKPEINYAPDMSIKDLRGPAQSALVRPSNALILTGGLGFFGWLALLVIILIPALFPIDADDGDKSKPAKPVVGLEPGLGAVVNEKDPPGDIKNDPARRSMFNFFGVDIAMLSALGVLIFLLILSPIFVGMIYSGIVTYGAVQIQNLEGYGWGIAASIMAMIPINSAGLLTSVAILAGFFLGMVVDDPWFLHFIVAWVMGLGTLVPIGVGAWVLRTLLSDTVVKGYEYKPD